MFFLKHIKMNCCGRNSRSLPIIIPTLIFLGTVLAGTGAADSSTYTPTPIKGYQPGCIKATADWWDTEIVALARQINPPDCSIAHNSPPSFFWPSIVVIPWNINYTPWYTAEEDYTLTLIYPSGIVKVYKTNRNYYNIPDFLPPGGPYTWTVTAKTTDTLKKIPVNRVSNPRTFYIANDAVPFVVPDINTVVDTVASMPHPRTSTKGSEWDAIIASVAPGGSRRDDFLKVKAQVDNFDMKKVGPFADGSNIGAEATRITVMYQLTGEAKYKDKIKEFISSVVTWDALEGPTSFKVNDLGATSWNSSLAKIYDVFYNDFTPDERTELLNSIIVRQKAAYASYDKDGTQRFQANSHGTEIMGKIIQVGLATAGDSPEQSPLLKDLLPLYIAQFTPWGGDDGGFNQLGSYFDWDISAHGLFFATIKAATGIDVFKKASLNNAGYFKLYTSPPGQPFNIYGDSHAGNMSNTATATRDQMRGLVAQKTPFYSYDGPSYLDQFPDNPTYKWMFDAGIKSTFNVPGRPLHLLAPVSTVSAIAPTKFPTSEIFPSVGTVTMHSSLVDESRTSVYFKSSPLGNWSHAHADQNSFIIFSKKLPLAIESGFYGKWGENWSTLHHVKWNKQTAAGNAITYDNGLGQLVNWCNGSARGNRTATGKITQYEFDGNTTITTGDATEAYRDPTNCNFPDKTPKLFSKAIRSLVYLKDKDVVLVFDDLEAPDAHQWEWNIHAVDKMTVAGDKSLSINNGEVTLCVSPTSTQPLSLVQSNKFDPDQIRASAIPEETKDPNAYDPAIGSVTDFAQWHARYYTPKVTQASFATVLKINCSANTTNVTVTKIDNHSWQANVDGKLFTFDGNKVIPIPSSTPTSTTPTSTTPTSSTTPSTPTSTETATTPGANSLYARQLYVEQSDPLANDSNDGSLGHPLKTITKAMALLKPGDEVIVGPGVYREWVKIPSLTWGSTATLIRSKTKGTAVINGSVLVSSWVPVSSDTYYTDWSSGVEPEQVFRNGVLLKQIAGTFDAGFPVKTSHILFSTTSGLSHVWPGRIDGTKDTLPTDSFIYDRETKRVYIRLTTPLSTGESLEVSDKLYVMSSDNAANVTIDGFTFTHSNTSYWARHGALHVNGSNNTFQNLTFTDLDAFCVTIGGTNNKLLNSYLDSCGEGGINGSGSGHLISGNYITNMNTRGFGTSWEASGMKFAGSELTNSTISNNTVTYNHGSGIWFDTSPHNNLIKGNVTAYNEGHGIHIEMSKAITTDSNFSYGNTLRGIYYFESADGVITNNLTIKNVFEGIAIADGTRSSPPYNNSVKGNISGWNGYTGLRLQLVLPGKSYSNTSDYNVFYHDEFLPRFMFTLFTSPTNPYYQGLVNWRAASSQDINSKEFKMNIPADISATLSARLLLNTSTLWNTLMPTASGSTSTTSTTTSTSSTSYSYTPTPIKGYQPGCTPASPDWMSKFGESWDRVTVFPEDCIVSENNPPAFYWASIATLPERNGIKGWYTAAEAYTLTLTYPTGEVRTYNTDRNYFSLPTMLPSGGPYTWTITASTTDTTNHVPVNKVSNPRHFYIASNADPLLIPDMNTLVSSITSRPRPWSKISNSQWAQIMSTFDVGGSRRSRYVTFLSNANTTKAIPIPIDDSIGSIPYATSLRGVASMNARYLEILRTAYDISGDESYFKKLHDWVLTITTWDYINGNTSMSKNDLDTEWLTMQQAIIYDRYKDKFTSDEQIQLKTNIMNRLAIQFAWEAAPGSRDNLRYSPESHHTESVTKIIVSCLLMLGEDPLAETYVRELFPLFVNILHPFGGEDGGHNQGGSYSEWDMSLYGTDLPYIKNITGVDLTKKTGFKNFGYFKIYTSPAGQAWNVFGDAHNSNIGPSTSILTHDQMSGKSPTSVFPWGYLGALYHDLYPTNAVYNWYRSTLGTVDDFNYPSRLIAPINTADSFTPGTSFPTSALFPSVGTVGAHSSLTDTMRTSVYFRSSPQGSYSHAHSDANSFVIFSKKMPLAIESGYYNIWGEDYTTTHHIKWDRQSASKNTITYDNGIGQHNYRVSYGGNRMASGKITQYEFDGNTTITTGDATEAYRDMANINPDLAPKITTKVIRSLVYLKDKDIVLVFDDLQAPAAHQWEWNIHAVNKMAIAKDQSLTINNNGVNLCVSSTSNQPLSLVQSNKFDPDQIRASIIPEATKDPNAYDPTIGTVTDFAQWHARYYTPKVTQASFATVLRINCDTNTTPVALTKIDDHSWQANVAGKIFIFDGNKVIPPTSKSSSTSTTTTTSQTTTTPTTTTTSQTTTTPTTTTTSQTITTPTTTTTSQTTTTSSTSTSTSSSSQTSSTTQASALSPTSSTSSPTSTSNSSQTTSTTTSSTSTQTTSPFVISNVQASNDEFNTTYQFTYTGGTAQFVRVWIDTDLNIATGYPAGGIGGDFMVENGLVYKYSGKGGSWSWTSVGKASTSIYSDGTVKFVVDRNLIGEASRTLTAVDLVYQVQIKSTVTYPKFRQTYVVKAPTVTVTALSPTVSYGGSTIISWTSTNALSCISPSGSTSGITGSFTTESLTIPTSFKVSCTNRSGMSASNSVTVNVLNQTSDVLTLPGTYIPEVTMPSCDPSIRADFLDQGLWSNRRLIPHDCALVQDNPPVFSWTQPLDRDTLIPWKLEIQTSAGASVFAATSPVPRLHLQKSFSIGTYQWRVTYTTKTKITKTSEWRRFAITAQSQKITFPKGTDIVTTVKAKSHTRILPNGKTFANVAAIAKASPEYAATYNALVKQGPTILSMALPLEPAIKLPSDPNYITWLGSMSTITESERIYTTLLAFLYKTTGTTTYRDAAISRVMNLINWDPNGASSEANQDQANRNIYFTIAIVYDLLYDDLTNAQKQLMISTMRIRISKIIAKYPKLDVGPYDSHDANSIKYVLPSLLMTAGDPNFPEADTWLASVWDLHMTLDSVWAEEDGGIGHSTGYGWYDIYFLPQILSVDALVTGQDVAKRAYFRNVGNFILASTTPNINQYTNFGDGIESRTLYSSYARDTYRLIAALTNNQNQNWYWKVNPANISSYWTISPLHYLILARNSNSTPATAVAPTKNNWLFADIGQAIFHSNVSDTLRSSLFFRSSRFGSYGHAHADQNSIVFTSQGKNLLINGGYYPWFGSPHHVNVGRSTRYKNTITFDGGIGQAEPDALATVPGAPVFSMEPRGNLVNYFSNDRMGVATGDATLAYRAIDKTGSGWWVPTLTAAYRSIVYLKGARIALWYDYADSPKDRTWEWNYHTPGKFTSTPNGLMVSNEDVSACMTLYAPPTTTVITNTFDIAPEVSSPAQMHARFSTNNKSKNVAAVTILAENCKQINANVVFEGSKATVKIGVETFVFNKKQVDIVNPAVTQPQPQTQTQTQTSTQTSAQTSTQVQTQKPKTTSISSLISLLFPTQAQTQTSSQTSTQKSTQTSTQTSR